MATVIDSANSRLLVARTLAWALLIGAWLVLGDLGRFAMPFELGGLAPTALFLGVAGVALHLGAAQAASATMLRFALLASAAVAAGGLLRADDASSPMTVAGVAVAWAVLLVAASRAVKMLRVRARHAPPPMLPAAAGAALAWLVAGDPAAPPTTAAAIALLGTATLLALMLPAGAVANGCRGGLFDCALPLGEWSQWSNPAKWPAQAAGWAMLPMMATLSVMAQWCRGEGGLSASAVVGLHLGAMLVPPLALHLLRVSLRTDAWAAAAMTAGLVLSLLSTGVQGLMLVSACQSLGWGLAWFARLGETRPTQPPTEPQTGFGALAPACCLALLGLTLASSGASALRGVQVGLGAIAAAGAVLSLLRPTPVHTLEKKP